MLISKIRREEGGAVLILVAAALIALMGFVALVADIGAGMNERRLDQTTIDVSVLGGAVDFIEDGTANAEIVAANAVIDITDLNMDPVPLVDWESCVDADAYTVQPLTNVECISFNSSYTAFRGRLPDQETPTTFARVMGFLSLTTHAFAEVSIEPTADVLPFGLFSFKAGEESCLKDASLTLPPPCDGPALGQFGLIDPIMTQEAFKTSFCTSNNDTFIYSLAVGIDHIISAFDPDYAAGAGVSPTNAMVQDGCTSAVPAAAPNTFKAATGNKINLIEKGLITGINKPACCVTTGRIAQTGTGASINGAGINNTPLWDYLVLGDCRTDIAGLSDPILKKDALLLCLQDWTGGLLFNDDIRDAVRFGFVPLFDENAEITPGDPYHINGFVPVYLQTLYVHKGAAFETHDPGENKALTGSSTVALTAIPIDCRMIPSLICEPDGEAPGATASNLYVIRLTK